MCSKSQKFRTIIVEAVICLLLVAAAPLFAQSLEQKIAGQPIKQELVKQESGAAETKNINESETVDEDEDVDVGEDEDIGEVDPDYEYNIYRKEHPDNLCDREHDTYDYEMQWYDHTQIYMNSRFCEPALWFDNFFATDRIFDEGVVGTYVRWRNDFSYDEEEYFEFKTKLTASVQLPILKKRLRLTFEGEEDESLRDITPGNVDEARGTLGLQFDFLENARSKFNVNITFTPRIRFRYRYTLPVNETLTLRLTQEVQRENSVHSAKTRFDYEKLLDENFLFRSSTEAKFSEEFNGADWLQAFVLFQRLDKKTSLSYETSVIRISKPVSRTLDYRLAIRFRKNFHRRWLFYEVSPEMTWPITYDDERVFVEQGRRSKWRLFFRLEIHFGNAQKKQYKDYN